MMTTNPIDEFETTISMKELLRRMFREWMLHDVSWDKETERYTRNDAECMTEACGGDEIMGSLLSLFGHRRNDVESLAPYYGIALARDKAGKLYIRDDIPPPPSLQHWWHEEEWTAPLDRETEEVAKP